jgi:FMN reductase
MTKPLKIVAISGSLQQPSRTEVLLDAIVGELAIALPVETHVVKLSEIGALVGSALTRSALPPRVYADIQAIEEADALVVATPVYRASYTGLLKHLFDFVGHESLVGRPILLAATGGSERHALMIEHQLRPLFSFFQALTLPLGIYASESDFDDYQLTSKAVAARIALAVDHALPWLGRPDARRLPALRQPFLAQL